MDFIESKGKTVDEAVFSGLLKMDLSLDEVEIEILDEGGGLFKSASVRMTKRTEPVISDTVETTRDAKPYQKQENRWKDDAPRNPYYKREGSQRSPYHKREEAPQRHEWAEEIPAEKQEPKNDAEKFLLGLFENMGLYVKLKSEQAGEIMKVDMAGRAMGMLIGRRGETLDALQYLTSLVVNNGKEGYTKIMLDTENYRRKREDALKKLAVRLAEKVLRSGKRIVLEPMNPYERRILHATLQDYKGVTTFSEGEDPYRSVVVAVKGQENAPIEEEQTE
jgi:spoIIIJ-associated protein